jgi:hypothetical protein
MLMLVLPPSQTTRWTLRPDSARQTFFNREKAYFHPEGPCGAVPF